jgi:threonine aldolase
MAHGETTSHQNGRKVTDLRSDTVTRPTPQMREAMAKAVVGDDQYGEDPTVRRLEQRAAELVGKEAAVYVPSGTMGNLTSVLAHCDRGDEIVIGDESHIFWYESAGPATVGGVSPRTVRTSRLGTYDLEEVEHAIREPRPGYPRTGLLCVETTYNRCGGVALPLEHLRALRDIADRHGIPVHMDGARIFNAAVALGVTPAEIASTVNSVQFCLSKALAAPVGSIVAGEQAFIQRVRRQRKVLGGDMRQSGVIAAAGLVALETMVDRLPEDHRRARMLAEGLHAVPGLTVDLGTVQSNIVVIKTGPLLDKVTFAMALKDAGVLVSDYGLRGLRMVTHYEISDEDVKSTLEIVSRVASGMVGEPARVPA